MADVDSILVGKRIELISMVDDFDPIPSGAQGVVQRVSIFGEITHIDVEWDPEVGRSLALCVPPDQFKIIA